MTSQRRDYTPQIFVASPPVQFLRMKKMTRVGAILWMVLGLAVWACAEPIASLRPSNYVNDFAGVLDAATQARLNDLCQQVEQ